MNKEDLVTEVATQCSVSKTDSRKVIEAVFEAITEALKNKKEVRLVGFGTFSVGDRKASEGRNPRTGEPIKIKAAKVPKFKAGKGLKDTVNAA